MYAYAPERTVIIKSAPSAGPVTAQRTLSNSGTKCAGMQMNACLGAFPSFNPHLPDCLLICHPQSWSSTISHYHQHHWLLLQQMTVKIHCSLVHRWCSSNTSSISTVIGAKPKQLTKLIWLELAGIIKHCFFVRSLVCTTFIIMMATTSSKLQSQNKWKQKDQKSMFISFERFYYFLPLFLCSYVE